MTHHQDDPYAPPESELVEASSQQLGMTFFQSVRAVLGKYATPSGRACRSEYWWFQLFVLFVGSAAAVLDLILGMFVTRFQRETGLFELSANLALILPQVAVFIRRLHDSGRGGWWLITVVPPMFFIFLKGDYGPNKYGPDPLRIHQVPSGSLD